MTENLLRMTCTTTMFVDLDHQEPPIYGCGIVVNRPQLGRDHVQLHSSFQSEDQVKVLILYSIFENSLSAPL